MPTMTNYKPEDITPAMRKYLGMPDQAQDAGTSEGAKKGWEKRHLGGTSPSAGDIIKNIKFTKVDGFKINPSSGMIVHIKNSSDPHIVSNPRVKWGSLFCDVINPQGEKKTISRSDIAEYWNGKNDGGPFPDNARHAALRLLRRWGCAIPDDVQGMSSKSYIEGDIDGTTRHFPSEREVFQPKGTCTWHYMDDKTPVPGF